MTGSAKPGSGVRASGCIVPGFRFAQSGLHLIVIPGPRAARSLSSGRPSAGPVGAPRNDEACVTFVVTNA